MFSSWREFEVAYALYSCVPRRDFLDAWIEVISRVEGVETRLDSTRHWVRAPRPRMSVRNSGLIHDGAPTAAGKIPVDNCARGESHGQQHRSRGEVFQQQLAGSEKYSIDQRASANPIDQVRKPAAQRTHVRRKFRNWTPSGCRWM